MCQRGVRMRSTGIVRKVDELGRVVLPVEIRRTLEIEDHDPLEIALEGDCILLRKFQPTCIFCGAVEELIEFRRKRVCRLCLQKLNEEDE